MKSKMQGSPYFMFAIMLLFSYLIMYGVMYLNVADTDHIYMSLTRAYMAALMVAPMALLKLIFMGKMYPNKKLNIGISIASTAVFIGVLVMLRSQTFVSDEQYMKAMIPHHSSAIMTSNSANLLRPEVLELAQDIKETQVREIELMKQYLEAKNKEKNQTQPQ